MSRIEKLLEAENWRLYNRVTLGPMCEGVCVVMIVFVLSQLSLNWRLSQEQSEHSSLRSYVSWQL